MDNNDLNFVTKKARTHKGRELFYIDLDRQ